MPRRPFARRFLAPLAGVLWAALWSGASADPPAGQGSPPPAPPASPTAPGPLTAGPRVDLPLVNGKTLSGVVESTDKDEVVLVVGVGERRRIPWGQLAPMGVWRAKAALEKPDDGKARLSLAELAADLGLYAVARAEYEKATALGAMDAKACEAAIADAEKRAIEAGVAHAQRLADSGDVVGALAAARDLKIDFAGAVDARRVDALLAGLLGRIKDRDADLKSVEADVQQAVLEAERNKRIDKHRIDARVKSQQADEDAAEARSNMPLGKVTRVRRGAEAAADAYDGARRDLGRLRRVVPEQGREHDEALASIADLDRRQFALLYDAAKFFWDQRVYDTADQFAARAAFVDPVDPRLLELRQLLRDVRIKKRMSDITNARPR